MSLLDICTTKYEFRSSIRTADVKRFAAKIHDDLAPEEASSSDLVILDIGTGLGDSALALREHFPNSRIIGIDINTPALEKARTAASEQRYERLEFYSLDISEPDFCDKFQQATGITLGGIHLAWSAYLVSQLTTSDRQIAMQNIQNILAPKGRIYLLDFIWSETDKIMIELNCTPEWRSIITAKEFLQDPSIFEQARDRDFSQKWLHSLETLDFEVLQIVSNKLHYQITSLSNLIQVLENICPTLNFIADETKRVEYFLEFFKRTFDHLFLPEFKNRITYNNLLICARKHAHARPASDSSELSEQFDTISL